VSCWYAVPIEALEPSAYPNGDQVQYLDLCFRCRPIRGEARVNDDESTDVGWFSLDALPDIPAREARCIANALRPDPAPLFLSQVDPQGMIDRDYGPTNYLFNAGTKYALKDNDGVFYQDSKIKLQEIPDGTSNTLLMAEVIIVRDIRRCNKIPTAGGGGAETGCLRSAAVDYIIT